MLLGQGFPGPDYQASLRHYDPYWSICQWMSIPWYRWIITQLPWLLLSGAGGAKLIRPEWLQGQLGHGQLLRLFSNDKTDRNLQPAWGPQFFSRASLDQLFGWRSKWHHNYKNKYDEIIQHPTGLQESPSFHFRPGKWRKFSAFGSSLKDLKLMPCLESTRWSQAMIRWFKPPFLIQIADIADFPVFKSWSK